MAIDWPLVPAPNGAVSVIVAGSRHWEDHWTVSALLERLRAQHPLLTVIEGGARGADQCGAQWAAENRARGVVWVHMPARWDHYDSATKWRAGHDRNQAMLGALLDAHARENGVLVLAFKRELDPRLFDSPAAGRGGTEHMIRIAWSAGVPVWHVARKTPSLLEPAQPPLT